ncbi:MAG: MBL fold metallo-hydrolase [Saprospiraceae bacterium]|nr:MBL fold metallo-hydrolase [Saprospiraceae bacterium]
MTFLGTGTSQGIPIIGCTCQVCTSADPRDQRLRCSMLLRSENTHIVIDTGPDFRSQMLQAKNTKLDAILMTHEHNDHIAGLDDVRPYNFMQWKDMPVYAQERVCDMLRLRYPYIFAEEKYPGAPMIELHPIDRNDQIQIGDFEITPVELLHGQLPILGFRIKNFAYLTDMKTIPLAEVDKLAGLETLVVNALHHKEHHSHLNLEQALEFVEQIKPKQTWLVHMSHHMGLHAEVNQQLPAGVALAYDGLEISIS